MKMKQTEVDEYITIDCGEKQTGGEFGESGQNREKSSFSSDLAVLCSLVYHLMDDIHSCAKCIPLQWQSQSVRVRLYRVFLHLSESKHA